MANFFEIKIPVRKNEGWNEWATKMRSTIKAAGIPVRWQMFHYHMTLLFLDDDNCVEDLNRRVSTDKVSLEQLQAVLRTIEQPVFNCFLNEAEHRYYRGDKIKTWTLK